MGGSGKRGRITSGIPRQTLEAKTLAFVREQLPSWRDDPDREAAESENALNEQLCKFLNAASRQRLPMVHFHHEQRQMGRSRVDLSANPTERGTISGQQYSKYQPFLVFEGKRLPAPEARREREYVRSVDKRAGGIQRFKLGLHGADLNVSAMIGYLQRGSVTRWHQTINAWITELTSAADTGDERWSERDRLQPLDSNVQSATAACQSTHERVGGA